MDTFWPLTCTFQETEVDSSAIVGAFFGVLATVVAAGIGVAAYKANELLKTMKSFMTKDEERMQVLDGAVVRLAKESAAIRVSVAEIQSIVKGAADERVADDQEQWISQYKASVQGYIDAGWSPEDAERQATKYILERKGQGSNW